MRVNEVENEAANKAIEEWEKQNKLADSILNKSIGNCFVDNSSDMSDQTAISLNSIVTRNYCTPEESDQMLARMIRKPLEVKPIFYLAWDNENMQYYCGNFRVSVIASDSLKRCWECLNKQKNIRKHTKNKDSIKLVDTRISELEKLIEAMISRIMDDYDKFNQA